QSPAELSNTALASTRTAGGRAAPQAPPAPMPGPSAAGGATAHISAPLAKPVAATTQTATAATPVAPSSPGDTSTATPHGVVPSPAPRSGTASLGFHGGLSGWDISVTGGSPAGKGSVTVGSAILREGDSFLVGLERSFTVPENPAPLVFRYTELNFDTADPGSIQDAFEASLMDAQGRNLVHPFSPGRDAFLNVTEDVGLALGPEAAQ